MACEFFLSAAEELDDENYPLQLANEHKAKLLQGDNHKLSEK